MNVMMDGRKMDSIIAPSLIVANLSGVQINAILSVYIVLLTITNVSAHSGLDRERTVRVTGANHVARLMGVWQVHANEALTPDTERC